jgi:glycosyltransferase involved in cell wall biosynthesis
VKYSIIIPVYNNEGSLPRLFAQLDTLARELKDLEVVFVVDGSPDNSVELIRGYLPRAVPAVQLLSLTRNFGAVRASRAGLMRARGQYLTIMAADLQEPPELAASMLRTVEEGPCRVALAVRTDRMDPPLTRLTSKIAWAFLRRTSLPTLPDGGFDTYAITREVRDHLAGMTEATFSPIAQLLWLGYPFKPVAYQRLKREHGKSAWKLRARARYFVDNVFTVTSAPLSALLWIGIIAFLGAVGLATSATISRLSGSSAPQGFTLLLVVLLGAVALQQISTVILGIYTWRTYQAVLRRPMAVVLHEEANERHSGTAIVDHLPLEQPLTVQGSPEDQPRGAPPAAAERPSRP